MLTLSVVVQLEGGNLAAHTGCCGYLDWSESLVRAGHWEALLAAFWRLMMLPGLSLAPEAQGAAQGDAGGPARRQGEEQSLRPHGWYPGKAGWHLPGGRAASEGLPPAMQGWAAGGRAERTRPLSSTDRPHSRLGSAGGGCG